MVDDLDSPALLKPVTEWSKGGQQHPDPSVVCHCIVDLCSAIHAECEKGIRWIEGHQRLDALLKDVFTALLAEFGAVMFVLLLEACHRERRRPNLRVDIPALAACSWAVRYMDELFQSDEWLQIQPDAMLTLMQFAVEEASTSPWPADWNTELPQQLERWAREGHSMDANASIRWLSGFNSPSSASFVHRAACHFLASSPEESAIQIVCGLLNESLRKQRDADEQRSVLCEGATMWCGQLAVQGRLAHLSRSPAWLGLSPAALVHASRGALAALDVKTEPPCLDDRRKRVAEAVSSWVDAAGTRSIFEAISVAASNSPEVFQLICRAARQRCTAIESQNADLGGGRYRAELDAAVHIAREETEARLRDELEAERACHEKAMANQKRHQEELRSKFIASIDALREELGEAVTFHRDYLMTSSTSDRPRSRPGSGGSNRRIPPPVRILSSMVSSLEPADTVEGDSEEDEEARS